VGNRLDKRKKWSTRSRHSTSPFECRVLDVLENNSPHTALSKQSSNPQCNPARVSANPSRATPQVTNVYLRPPSAAIVPRYLIEKFGPQKSHTVRATLSPPYLHMYLPPPPSLLSWGLERSLTIKIIIEITRWRKKSF